MTAVAPDIRVDALSAARPLLKSAGGKRSLMPTLFEHAVPAKFNTYYEPFFGGGALFFELYNQGRLTRAVIGDTNADFISTYAAVADDEELKQVIRRLKRMKNDSEFFVRMRNQKPKSRVEIAARTIYLNKTCFNGLWRVNSKGQFNVPFGRYKHPKICDEANLRACNAAFRDATILHGDFERTIADIAKGDFVFFDPPYMPRVGNEFVAYGAEHFTLKDQHRLRDVAEALIQRGVHVAITNSGAVEIRELYSDPIFTVIETRGARMIGASALSRGHIPDLLIT